jgi:hypothetical protein
MSMLMTMKITRLAPILGPARIAGLPSVYTSDASPQRYLLI